MRHAEPTTTYLKDYTTCGYHVLSLDLTFDLTDDVCTVTSIMQIETQDQTKPCRLNGENIVLQAIYIDDVVLEKAAYDVDDEYLTLLTPPKKFTLKIINTIQPLKNTQLSGLYRTNELFCTQCEAQGFRRITYFFDRPDVLTFYTTTIRADKKKYPVLLSNGNLIESGECEDGRHYVKWQDPFKKPCYLFALVAGVLAHIEDEFITASGRTVTLRIFTEPKDINKSHYAMDALKRAMRWDEEVYGLEYDLDIFMIVSVSDFNMGAMENKGLNVFNNQYLLAQPDIATDQDYLNIEGVVAHEYFHNWSGNRVTCRDWFQLSLKEGLTIFRDQAFSSDMNHRALCRIQDVRVLRNIQFPEDAGPMAHPVRPESYIEMNNFYTATVYNKGAEVIRMMHTMVGEKAYRKGTDLYFKRHDGQAVTIEDFATAIEEGAGVDLSQFRLWYSQAGTPKVTITREYVADQKKLLLHCKQQCKDTPGQQNKKPFVIPIKMSILSNQGEPQILQLTGEMAPSEHERYQRVICLTQATQTFSFDAIESGAIPSVFQDFSAPVICQIDYTEEELQCLIQHDLDLFNRYEACSRLAKHIILEKMCAFRGNEQIENHVSLAEALQSLLQDKSIEPAFIAECLRLPSIIDIANSTDAIDLDAIVYARKALLHALADALAPACYERYAMHTQKGSYKVSADAIGARSLKNICLYYLLQQGAPEYVDLAQQQYEQADNMTDSMGALSAIVNAADAAASLKAPCLARFYEKWQGEELVINKWFALQATADSDSVLDDVLALQSHPAFSLNNPNRARALISSFAAGNLPAFHDKSGKGYTFVADKVIAMDSRNPQVAARIVSCFNQWKRYDEARQVLMKQQLERILGQDKLSKDVYEIVSKALV